MAGEVVKVFGTWGSVFSRKVELALKLKGIEYAYIEEDLTKKSPLLLQYNPVHKKIPVLLHGDKALAESAIILEYIDEMWKENPILPVDPYEKAKARFWAKFVDEKCTIPAWMAFWSEGKEQEKFIEESLLNLKTLETALNGKKFFGGDSIGLVDITACFISNWVGPLQEAVGITLVDAERFPILCKWIEDFLSISIVTENLPPKEELAAFFKAHKETISATKKVYRWVR